MDLYFLSINKKKSDTTDKFGLQKLEKKSPFFSAIQQINGLFVLHTVTFLKNNDIQCGLTSGIQLKVRSPQTTIKLL